jgi:hypothetical protein
LRFFHTLLNPRLATNIASACFTRIKILISPNEAPDYSPLFIYLSILLFNYLQCLLTVATEEFFRLRDRMIECGMIHKLMNIMQAIMTVFNVYTIEEIDAGTWFYFIILFPSCSHYFTKVDGVIVCSLLVVTSHQQAS